jgi:hypothetical protein
VPVGHFFDVMTNGFGVMPDYRTQVPTADRWRIAAYIRALQLTEHGAVTDVPAADLQKLQNPETPAAEAPAATEAH